MKVAIGWRVCMGEVGGVSAALWVLLSEREEASGCSALVGISRLRVLTNSGDELGGRVEGVMYTMAWLSTGSSGVKGIRIVGGRSFDLVLSQCRAVAVRLAAFESESPEEEDTSVI